MTVPKAIYDSLEDIPETINFRELFTQKGDKFELTGIPGLKTEADVSRLTKSLSDERKVTDSYKEKLKLFGDGGEVGVDSDMDAWRGRRDQIFSDLDRIPALEAAGKDKLDNAKIEELVEKRLQGVLASRVNPLEREIRDLTTERDELRTSNETWMQKETSRLIREDLRAAATHKDVGVRPEAIADVLDIGERLFERTEDGKTVTRDGVGVPPGIDARTWLLDGKDTRPHWWPPSVGGGAGGSGGRGGGMGNGNPFSHENWDMREQQRILAENPDRAEQLAKMAGTTIGRRPAPKK